MTRNSPLGRPSILGIVLLLALTGCGSQDDTAIPTGTDADPTADCRIVKRAVDQATSASNRKIAEQEALREQALADRELFETNPKKYWKKKRAEAIERGMDPDQAKRLYSEDGMPPLFMNQYTDPQDGGARAFVEAFTSSAAALWPKVSDPDLKAALKDLGEGTNQSANYRAIASICSL